MNTSIRHPVNVPTVSNSRRCSRLLPIASLTFYCFGVWTGLAVGGRGRDGALGLPSLLLILSYVDFDVIEVPLRQVELGLTESSNDTGATIAVGCRKLGKFRSVDSRMHSVFEGAIGLHWPSATAADTVNRPKLAHEHHTRVRGLARQFTDHL